MEALTAVQMGLLTINVKPDLTVPSRPGPVRDTLAASLGVLGIRPG
jgi:hypothetical protein